MSKTLHLTLKRKWYDMIKSGEKKEEYREIKPYWAKRLSTELPLSFVVGGQFRNRHTGANHVVKHFDTVTFSLGYNPATRIVYECLGIEIRGGNPEWGASPGVDYFVIELGERLA